MSSAVAPALLRGAKGTQLRALAAWTGIASSGTKLELAQRVTDELASDTLAHHNHVASNSSVRRILSVDMGLRNLAYCVLELPRHAPRGPLTPPDATQGGDNIDTLLDDLRDISIFSDVRVTHWQRFSLSPRVAMVETDPAIAVDDHKTTKQANTNAKTDAFTPSVLARLAYSLVKDTFLPLDPSAILLEQQRYRSGGGSAVQEWTLRVNAFEGMLWSVLHTLSRESTGLAIPRAHSVSPNRVARFWLDSVAPQDNETEPRSRSSKALKKAKIDLVDSWLRGGRLNCTGDAAALATAMLERSTTRSRAKPTLVSLKGARGTTKLDDLADCLLQGLAWAQWAANRDVARAYLGRT